MTYQTDIERCEAQIAKLQAFKDFVHARLDAAGIPTHPEGQHAAEGCRVGERLRVFQEQRDTLRAGVRAALDALGLPPGFLDAYDAEVHLRALWWHLWESIHGRGAKDVPTWVWVISFRRITADTATAKGA